MSSPNVRTCPECRGPMAWARYGLWNPGVGILVWANVWSRFLDGDSVEVYWKQGMLSAEGSNTAASN